jgi:hypothetical protein
MLTAALRRWPEFYSYYGFDLKQGKINIPGEGDAPMSSTSIGDVARFVAHVLTALPRAQLEGARFRIEGERTVRFSHPPPHIVAESMQTWNKIAAELQVLAKKPLEITHTPRAEFERRRAENPHDVLATLFLGWDTGLAALEPLSNDLWPEWKPKKVVDILRPMMEA